MLTFSVEEAQRFAAADHLDEWVQAFLATVGRNEPLARGLQAQQRWWIGPVLFPLRALTRCLGPEPTMEYCVPSAYWEQRLDAMCADLQRGWEPAPLLVEYRGALLSVRDGSHRHGALLKGGLTRYWCIFWFNTATDRQAFAVSYAADLALPVAGTLSGQG